MELEKTMEQKMTYHSEAQKMKPFARYAEEYGDEKNENDDEAVDGTMKIQKNTIDLQTDEHFNTRKQDDNTKSKVNINSDFGNENKQKNTENGFQNKYRSDNNEKSNNMIAKGTQNSVQAKDRFY